MTKLHLTLVFFALTFYCLGAGLMEHFALFFTWTLAGRPEFAHLHHASGLRALYVYVLPLTGLLALNVLLFRHGLPALSRRWLGAGLACHLVTWVSSALIQIPLQLQLDQAPDAAALHRLLLTDWIRLGALLGLVGVTLVLIRQALAASRAARFGTNPAARLA